MNMDKLITISDLSKQLNLVNSNNGKPLNYILRYWEKEFKQIKPKIINNRRYYSSKQVEIIKLIRFLLKDKGMTIKGAKNLLNNNNNELDYRNHHSLKAMTLKNKGKKILKKIKDLKKYGKKNSH
tara:strand:- start:113 stop:487 length:375 start_codon:yes stop_codon:yes gene_type:complete